MVCREDRDLAAVQPGGSPDPPQGHPGMPVVCWPWGLRPRVGKEVRVLKRATGENTSPLATLHVSLSVLYTWKPMKLSSSPTSEARSRSSASSFSVASNQLFPGPLHPLGMTWSEWVQV